MQNYPPISNYPTSTTPGMYERTPPLNPQTSQPQGSYGLRREFVQAQREFSLENQRTDQILNSVKSQEAQFDRLTRELEEERQTVANQLSRVKLGSETASLKSISDTEESFQYRPHTKVDDYSDTESRVSYSTDPYGSLHNPGGTFRTQLPLSIPEEEVRPGSGRDTITYYSQIQSNPQDFVSNNSQHFSSDYPDYSADFNEPQFDSEVNDDMMRQSQPHNYSSHNQPRSLTLERDYERNPSAGQHFTTTTSTSRGFSHSSTLPGRPTGFTTKMIYSEDGAPMNGGMEGEYPDPRSPGFARTPADDLNYIHNEAFTRHAPSPGDPRFGQTSSLSSPSDPQGFQINNGPISPEDAMDNTTLARVQRWRNPTLGEVIEYLSHKDSRVVSNAAAYLQHLTFDDDAIKLRVRELQGIQPLMVLLDSPVPDIKKNALGCLRNITFGRTTSENKISIRNAGGIQILARLLKTTDDADVRELCCAVLWNMSSERSIKRDILIDAVPTLVAVIIVPESGYLQADEARYQMNEQALSTCSWSLLFRNASGVIRNLSAEGEEYRQKLREIDNLIDALLHVLNIAIDRQEWNVRPVENTCCILRNLTYHLSDELERAGDPRLQKEMPIGVYKAMQNGKKKKSTSCLSFDTQSKSSQKKPGTLRQYTGNEIPESDPHAKGVVKLWQPDILRIFNTLLHECSVPDTLEASAGVMQNMCAGDYMWTGYMRTTVRKIVGLPVLRGLLASFDNDYVITGVAGALKNIALDLKNKELIGLHMTSELVQHLPPSEDANYAEFNWEKITMILLCLCEVCRFNFENAKHLHSADGVRRVIPIAKSTDVKVVIPKAIKAAEKLLTELWAIKQMRGIFKDDNLVQAHFTPGTQVALNKTYEASTLSRTVGKSRSQQSGVNESTENMERRGQVNNAYYPPPPRDQQLPFNGAEIHQQTVPVTSYQGELMNDSQLTGNYSNSYVGQQQPNGGYQEGFAMKRQMQQPGHVNSSSSPGDTHVYSTVNKQNWQQPQYNPQLQYSPQPQYSPDQPPDGQSWV